MRYLLIVLLLFIGCDDDPVSPIHGCLDSQACNYNSNASIDNNSCIYYEGGYDCDGNMVVCPNDPIGTITGNNDAFDESCWGEATIIIGDQYETFNIQELSGINFDDYIITSIQNEFLHEDTDIDFNWTTDGNIVTVDIIGFSGWQEFNNYVMLTGQYDAVYTTSLTFNYLLIAEE